MLHMVCYNLDKFRRFVFESKFLERFVVDDETVDKIRRDDVELLKFGFKWLKFALFGEAVMEILDPDKERDRLGGAPGARSRYERKE